MKLDTDKFDQELKSLKIDRNSREQPPRAGWLASGIVAVVLVAAVVAWLWLQNRKGAVQVETLRVAATTEALEPGVVLNATGYIVAHHKIEVSSKVAGRVAWIGVEKGDRVRQGQVLVRLEDAEYRAQADTAKGNVAALLAKLRELEAGSRPEEIAAARANLAQARADTENARINLQRARELARAAVLSQEALDNAVARYESMKARSDSLEKTYELVRLGPRQEQIDSARGALEQARGQLAYAQTLLDSTVIRAPVTGTILERAVEVGEFVTTSFVGERGAKGYVASLADLNDLQVELDINQDDFARLGPRQRGTVTTDAFPDRRYDGIIEEISPQADRQKATVQVKVKVLQPDDYLRPEMNARVAFLAAESGARAGAKASIVIPASAVHNNKTVFVVQDGKASKRAVKIRSTGARGVEIGEGLAAGEQLIVNPPADLKNGEAVKTAK